MKLRIITSIIAFALFITFMIIGSTPLIVFFAFIATIGNFEIRHSMGLKFRLGDIISSIFITFMFFLPADTVIAVLCLYIFFELLISMLIDKYLIENVRISIFSMVYSALPFVLLSRLVLFSKVENYYILAFLVPWISDVFAYFIGLSFGTKNIFPNISPNKTLEGCVGGFIAAFFINFIISLVFIPDISILNLIVILAITCIASQLGDLLASYIKRVYVIKDFGKILPGHGGIIDRFDSLILVTVCLYIFQIFI